MMKMIEIIYYQQFKIIYILKINDVLKIIFVYFIKKIQKKNLILEQLNYQHRSN